MASRPPLLRPLKQIFYPSIMASYFISTCVFFFERSHYSMSPCLRAPEAGVSNIPSILQNIALPASDTEDIETKKLPQIG